MTASKKDSSFLKIGNGELHIKAKPRFFGAVAGVSLAFSIASMGASLTLGSVKEDIEPVADKCLTEGTTNKCSKTELRQIIVHEDIKNKIADLNNFTIFWLSLSALSGLAGANIRTSPKKRKATGRTKSM